MRFDGLHAGPGIPVGSTIAARYWAHDSNYTPFSIEHQFEDKRGAMLAAREELLARVAEYEAEHPPTQTGYMPPRIRPRVVLRWTFQLPTGGTFECDIESTTFDDLADLDEGITIYNQFDPNYEGAANAQ